MPIVSPVIHSRPKTITVGYNTSMPQKGGKKGKKGQKGGRDGKGRRKVLKVLKGVNDYLKKSKIISKTAAGLAASNVPYAGQVGIAAGALGYGKQRGRGVKWA